MAISNRFTRDLLRLLEEFDLDKALELSDSIHKAEELGYDVSDSEDHLWERLTHRIETSKAS